MSAYINSHTPRLLLSLTSVSQHSFSHYLQFFISLPCSLAHPNQPPITIKLFIVEEAEKVESGIVVQSLTVLIPNYENLWNSNNKNENNGKHLAKPVMR